MKPIEVGIIGNPNSGKTTLFNALTGEKQQVGNWPGVTVEKKIGCFKHHHQLVNIVDLPGTYSLTVASEDLSLDERIACDYLLSHRPNLIINVIDASNLERNLFLTLQLLEMGVPVVIALNMMDVVRKNGLDINIDLLAKYLGCPVIPLEATKKNTVMALKAAIVEQAMLCRIPMVPFAYPMPLERAVDDVISSLQEKNVKNNYSNCRSGLGWDSVLQDSRLGADASCHDSIAASKERLIFRRLALKLLENDCLAQSQVSPEMLEQVKTWQQSLIEKLKFEPDIIMAEARYSFIESVLQHVVQRGKSKRSVLSHKIDQIVLNRFLGIPIFLLVMFAMFVFAINVAGILQDYFDSASDFLFVQKPEEYLQKMALPSWLVILVAQGLGKGLNTVITFIPVICGMFLSLSFLEQSGYMARAAFVVDRLMRAMGLPGKAFVPMIVGFGCNVPAVMATRTLENKRDRILTVMMTPFMSCGARLAIFAVFAAAFFPHHGAWMVFSLYCIGIVVAVLTGFILRKTLLKGESAPFVLELPSYHWPTWQSLRLHTWFRLQGFVWRAGMFIVPICILVEVLDSLTLPGAGSSLLAVFAQYITPLFAPMGIDQHNWPATVGLLTGLLAKEVVVGTLNSLYGQLNAVGEMAAYFDGANGAFAYLLFVLLYFPCVSTTAAIGREIGKSWAWFSVLWSTFIAYGVAVFFYQAVTWARHPWSSALWLVGISLIYVLTFYLLKRYSPATPILSQAASNKRPRCGGCLS